MEITVKNEAGEAGNVVPDLVRGLGITFGVLAILLALGLPLGFPSAAAGVWFVWLFAWRKVWTPSCVRVLYRRRWTRAFLWPLSARDRESCIQILRAFSWLYLVMGGLLVLIDLNARAR